MNDQIGERWFKGVFLKNCGPERPQLLMLDGHSSHESLAILECAMENEIQFLSTTSYSSTLSFGHLVRSTIKHVQISCLKTSSMLKTNGSFPGLIKMAWDRAFRSENIKSGFEDSCIFPFNR